MSASAELSGPSAGALDLERPLRVLLADDHSLIRDGLRLLVSSQGDMTVVGEAVDGAAAVELARQLLPDVLVLDLSMPVLGGAEATRRVCRECPTVRVVALTVHEERSYLAQLLKAGASGYVLKRSAPEDLVAAVRAVASGGTYIDPSVARAFVDGYLRSRTREEAVSHRHLSEREREVLIRVAEGYSNKEIANDLGLSVKTVETYKSRCSEKLGIKTRVEIARFVAEHRLSSKRSSADPD